MAIVRIKVSRLGNKCGQHHHRAKITDSLVQKLRDLNENWGLGWRRLAAQFELNPNTVKSILSMARRNTLAVEWRWVDTDNPYPNKGKKRRGKPKPPVIHRPDLAERIAALP
jgi:hypothetical protein